ncbi:MAG: hypothetical protein R6V48_07020, partial [Fidelibacterota bacterium]
MDRVTQDDMARLYARWLGREQAGWDGPRVTLSRQERQWLEEKGSVTIIAVFNIFCILYFPFRHDLVSRRGAMTFDPILIKRMDFSLMLQNLQRKTTKYFMF